MVLKEIYWLFKVSLISMARPLMNFGVTRNILVIQGQSYIHGLGPHEFWCYKKYIGYSRSVLYPWPGPS
jgi:hypothetical protein